MTRGITSRPWTAATKDEQHSAALLLVFGGSKLPPGRPRPSAASLFPAADGRARSGGAHKAPGRGRPCRAEGARTQALRTAGAGEGLSSPASTCTADRQSLRYAKILEVSSTNQQTGNREQEMEMRS